MSSNLMTSRTHSATFSTLKESPFSEDDHPAIGVGICKGWCSERVPLSGYRARRLVAASGLMPFSSGRTLPSKWDDAERWISSPVSVGNGPSSYYVSGVARSSGHLNYPHHSQRRAKSKSGPLGPAGLVSYGSFNGYSPVLGMGVINGGSWRNSVASPGLGVGGLDGEVGVNGREARKSCPGVHGDGGPEWPDLWSGPPSPSHQGEKNIDGSMEHEKNQNCTGEAGVDRAVSRRDMATQMFLESEISSSHSSVASTPRCSNSPISPRPLLNEASRNVVQSPESEVRDVQVDKQSSTTRRTTSDRNEFNDNPSSLAFKQTNKAMSKEVLDNYCIEQFGIRKMCGTPKQELRLQREEARINAWENLQKAKAEAAIQKLEMKLEKKRSSTMEKIIEKLRRAETKAQKMRSSISKGNEAQIQGGAVARNTSKLPSFCRKFRLSSSARSCSTCYPF